MPEFKFDLQEVVSRIEPVLAETVRLGRFNLTFEMRNTTGLFDRQYENPDLVVALTGPDADLLLENKAELLRALEHVVLEAADLTSDEWERVMFDCQEYRMMRVDELQLSARAAAEKVRKTGTTFKFNPMNSRERRMIHMALRGEAGVRTQSEGMGSYRLVVVYPEHFQQSQHQPHSHRPSR